MSSVFQPLQRHLQLQGQRSITYKSYCLNCCAKAGVTKEDIKDNTSDKYDMYFGESKKDLASRSITGHLADHRNQTDDSHIMKHWSAAHSQECRPRDIKFGFSVVKQHKSSFARQIFESVLIFRGGARVLNSKSEFSRCTVPRLTVSFGDKQHEAAAAAIQTDEDKVKRKCVETDVNLNLPAKRRRRRGQYDQSIGPPVTVSGSASPGVSGGAGQPQGHGGGQPQQQHRDTGHSLGVDDGGDVRAVPTFKDLIPHHHRPRPTIIETRAASRGHINYYFKTSDGASSRTNPHHPT